MEKKAGFILDGSFARLSKIKKYVERRICGRSASNMAHSFHNHNQEAIDQIVSLSLNFVNQFKSTSVF